MSSPGLSLVGFMDQAQAVEHLQCACIPVTQDFAALVAEWSVARAKLGAAFTNAGHPQIMPLPTKYDAHVQALFGLPAFQPGSMLHGVTVSLVEIDPLLAYQYTVDTPRSSHHCSGLSNPSIDEMMDVCLPLATVSEDIQAFQGPQSIILKSKSLNVRTLAAGMFNQTIMGMQFGMSLPFVHVVHHNGLYYLHNGFHRASGLRRAGATHMPCLVRNVGDSAAVGIVEGSTFSAQLLTSANPPTVGHFTQGRAHDVALREHIRVMHVSWAEYVIPNE